MRIVPQRINLVGAERIYAHICRAFLQLQRAGNLVGNHREADAFNDWRRCPVRWVSFDDDFLVLLLRNESKRPATNGVSSKVTLAARRDNADRAVRKIR